MSQIKFASEVYTWFMQGTGKGYDNKLGHMIEVAAQSGFKGIEPMVLQISDQLGLCKYWMGDYGDPSKLKDTLAKHNVELCGLALICGWDGDTETDAERECADWTMKLLKHFPGAMLGTVTLPSGRKNDLQKRRLNVARNINAVSQRAADLGIKCSYHPNSPPASIVRTQEDYDVVLSSLDPNVTGWTPDVGHIIRGDMDVIATLNKWAHLVNHIHYKDFSGNGPEPWAQMGTGKLDFHKITEWLVSRNYKGWIVCEDECHDAIGDPDGVTRQNGKWCKENLLPMV